MKGIIMLGLAAMVGHTSAARADVPPPNDYVENCTVAKQQEGGKECVACDAWHGERDKCKNAYAAQGYEHMCKSWGASAWTEVWCKPGAAKVPAVVPEQPKPDPKATTPSDKPAEQPMPKTADVPAPKKSNCAGGGVETSLGLLGALAVLARRKAR